MYIYCVNVILGLSERNRGCFKIYIRMLIVVLGWEEFIKLGMWILVLMLWEEYFGGVLNMVIESCFVNILILK